MIIGVDMALLLGVLAGLLDFIPNFGPAIAFVPAALVAAESGKVVPVIVLYVLVQIVEGWVLRPIIEQKAVDTLPAVLLASQVLFATLVGFMGLLAAPAVIVLVQVLVERFYVEDMLGDRERDEASEA
jgi:predicted PurR-regulated permease PerM